MSRAAVLLYELTALQIIYKLTLYESSIAAMGCMRPLNLTCFRITLRFKFLRVTQDCPLKNLKHACGIWQRAVHRQPWFPRRRRVETVIRMQNRLKANGPAILKLTAMLKTFNNVHYQTKTPRTFSKNQCGTSRFACKNGIKTHQFGRNLCEANR